MRAIKSLPIKRFGKQDRERKVLIGLVDYYIKTGKPVGSNALKEAGFEDLSSATIRNYFSNLEQEGYLSQLHASGGRIPTNLAFRMYAQAFWDAPPESTTTNAFKSIQNFDSKEITKLLQESSELLGSLTNCAVFLSAPRFDNDFIADLKLVVLDATRCLGIIITDFGIIRTEVMSVPIKLSTFAVKRIESYFHWRLTGINTPEKLDPEEEILAQSLYNEIMVRYIVGYSNFTNEEIHRTGFSRLLIYPDFQDASILASSLALFENIHSMRLLLKECTTLNSLKFWIGDDLAPFSHSNQIPDCAVLAIPYYINQKVIGAVGLLGPTRVPYRNLFGHIRSFSEHVSDTLTRNIYKFKITYRQPQTDYLYLKEKKHPKLAQKQLKLLEDKRIQNGAKSDYE